MLDVCHSPSPAPATRIMSEHSHTGAGHARAARALPPTSAESPYWRCPRRSLLFHHARCARVACACDDVRQRRSRPIFVATSKSEKPFCDFTFNIVLILHVCQLFRRGTVFPTATPTKGGPPPVGVTCSRLHRRANSG